MGQAVLPTDFSGAPFGNPEGFGIVDQLGNVTDLCPASFPTDTFLARLDKCNAGELEHVVKNGREYYFAVRAGHTDTLLHSGGQHYPIVTYPLDGKLDADNGGPGGFHPLFEFMHSDRFLDGPGVDSEPSEVPTGPIDVLGRLVRSDPSRGLVAVANQILRFRVVDAIDGLPVVDVQTSFSGTDGTFAIDVRQVFKNAGLATPAAASDYAVEIDVGDGLAQARRVVRQVVADGVTDLGEIDLTLAETPQLTQVAGVVIDGQTEGRAIAGATVIFKAGVGLPADLLREVPRPPESGGYLQRFVASDASGHFVVQNLMPGFYTVLVEAPGYISQMQGSVWVDPSLANNLTLSVLSELGAASGAVTLRWSADTGAAGVSRDLDSHWSKYTTSQDLIYHIYYSNKRHGDDSLDRDDTTYEGPETVTFNLDSSADYIYYVHNYSGGAATIPGSRPSVVLRLGSVTREFTIPGGFSDARRFWHVFTLAGGQVVPCEVGCFSDIRPDNEWGYAGAIRQPTWVTDGPKPGSAAMRR